MRAYFTRMILTSKNHSAQLLMKFFLKKIQKPWACLKDSLHGFSHIFLKEYFMSIQNQLSGHERISCVYREGYRVVRSPCNQFRRENIKTVHSGLQSVKYLGPKIWQLVPNNIKYGIPLSKFMKLVKPWQPEACPAGCVRHLLLKYSFFNYLIICKYFTSHV